MINNEHIDELISKYLLGEASPEEAMLLDAWKEESPENQKYFDDCRQVMELSFGNVDIDLAWKTVEPKLQKDDVRQLHPKRNFLAMAAVLVLMLGVTAVLVYYFNNQQSQQLVHKAGPAAEQILLEDQTSINLAPHAEISYSEEFGKTNRVLKLKGAAYFEVKHNDELPFIVDAGDVYIKDIGTKFDIKASKDTDTIYVKVDEGIVLLFDSTGNELIIRASEKAVYIKSVKKIVKEEPSVAGQLPMLDFNGMRLADVVNDLQKRYKVSIKIGNEEINDCLITTQFNNESLETVLTVITETLGISYEKTKDGYLVKGKKCNG